MRLIPAEGRTGRIDISDWEFDTEGLAKSYADWMQTEGMRLYLAKVFEDALKNTFEETQPEIIMDEHTDAPLVCIVAIPLGDDMYEMRFSFAELVVEEFINRHKHRETGRIAGESANRYAINMIKTLRDLADVVEARLA